MIRLGGGVAMSKLMWVFGAVLTIAGVLLGAKSIISPGQMQIYGLTPETAAILLVGGILSIGFAAVLGAIPNLAGFEVEQETSKPISMKKESTPAVRTVSEKLESDKSESLIRPAGFGRKANEMGAALTTAAAATTAAAIVETKAASTTASNSVADTIAALEQAKSDIKTALGGVESLTEPAAEPEPVHAEIEEPAIAVEEAAEGELYVVEEKIIRGRPSRILSDDTVEAETDEGWMRFENLEHLNEYLDSVEA
jgi:hypothetical protein